MLKSPQIQNWQQIDQRKPTDRKLSKKSLLQGPGGQYTHATNNLLSGTLIETIICSKVGNMGESIDFDERDLFAIHPTPPPKLVRRGLCRITQLAGVSDVSVWWSYSKCLSNASIVFSSWIYRIWGIVLKWLKCSASIVTKLAFFGRFTTGNF